MTSLSLLTLAAIIGERLTTSLLVIGVKFGIKGTPLRTSCTTGVDVLDPVTNIFLSFGLKTDTEN